MGDGPTVAAEFTLKARTAKGEPYENDYCIVLESADGLIRAAREYTDTVTSKRVLFGDRGEPKWTLA